MGPRLSLPPYFYRDVRRWTLRTGSFLDGISFIRA